MQKLIFVCVCLVGMVWTSFAQNISDKDRELLATIKQKNEAISTIQGDITQARFSKLLKEKSNSTGKMYYATPFKLALRYTDPANDYMIFANDKVYIKTKGKQNEVSTKANARLKGIQTLLAAGISGDILAANPTSVICSDEANLILITASIDKKVNKAGIAELQVTYDKKTYAVQIVRAIESDGSYTEYSLSNTELNKNIDNKIFTK